MRCKSAIRLMAPAGLAAMLLVLTGCGQGGGPLGILGAPIPPPDEFQVIPRKPLVIPASSALPEPHPGAPSPLDPDPHRDALRALMGTTASPAVESMAPSAGEQVLLSSANAAAASGDIRVQLEQDKAKAEASKPYQPPSLGELFSGGKKKKLDEKQLLDPVAESQRLQREGLAAPVDPNAAPETKEERPRREESPYPSGRPRDRNVVKGTTPAY